MAPVYAESYHGGRAVHGCMCDPTFLQDPTWTYIQFDSCSFSPFLFPQPELGTATAAPASVPSLSHRITQLAGDFPIFLVYMNP
jgi:hypothetical protein